MESIYVVGAKRTAIGKFTGSLKSTSPALPQAKVIQQILIDLKIAPEVIEEVVEGNVLSAGYGRGIGGQAGGQAVILAGLPETTVEYSINFLCGSGMKAIMVGESEIKANRFSVVIVGET